MVRSVNGFPWISHNFFTGYSQTGTFFSRIWAAKARNCGAAELVRSTGKLRAGGFTQNRGTLSGVRAASWKQLPRHLSILQDNPRLRPIRRRKELRALQDSSKTFTESFPRPRAVATNNKSPGESHHTARTDWVSADCSVIANWRGRRFPFAVPCAVRFQLVREKFLIPIAQDREDRYQKHRPRNKARFYRLQQYRQRDHEQ